MSYMGVFWIQCVGWWKEVYVVSQEIWSPALLHYLLGTCCNESHFTPLSVVNHPQGEEGKEINFRVYSCSKIWNCMETDRNDFLWGPMGLNKSELKSPKKLLLLLYCWLIVIMQDELKMNQWQLKPRFQLLQEGLRDPSILARKRLSPSDEAERSREAPHKCAAWKGNSISLLLSDNWVFSLVIALITT